MKKPRRHTVTATISLPTGLLQLIDSRAASLNLTRTSYLVRLAALDLGLTDDRLPPVKARRALPGLYGAPTAARLNETAPRYGVRAKPGGAR